MNSTLPPEHVQFGRSRYLPDVELVSVAYRDRSFPEHQHDEFVIGAITAGAEVLTVNRCDHRADLGSVLRLRPGEAHANATCGSETLRYVVLYIPPAVFEQQMAIPYVRACGFQSPVIGDLQISRIVRKAHAILADQTTDRLEHESAISALAEAVGFRELGAIAHFGDPAIVECARSFIDAHFTDNFSLEQLSSQAGVSTCHLVRLFKRSIGLSPLAYRNQRRLAAARRRLAEGESPVEIALDLGYADQSHFTRHFQRIVGTSPKRYARGVALVRQNN